MSGEQTSVNNWKNTERVKQPKFFHLRKQPIFFFKQTFFHNLIFLHIASMLSTAQKD